MALDGFPFPLIIAHEQHGVACGTAHQTNPSSVAPGPMSRDWEEVVYKFVVLPCITCKGGSLPLLGAVKARVLAALT